jgi:hypothetical protein
MQKPCQTFTGGHMNRIYALLALGLLVGCGPSQPKQITKSSEQPAAQTQVEEKTVAQETAPVLVPVTPSK